MNLLLQLFGAFWRRWRAFQALCIGRSHLARLAGAGRGIRVGADAQFHGHKGIRIADDVVIGPRAILRAQESYPWTDPPQAFTPSIEIGRGTFLSHDVHIACVHRIVIGEEVMLADRCYVADNTHGYEDPLRSVKSQPVRILGEVRIGDGSWIGSGCCITGPVTIGKHVVVGANSVVNRDLPDYCVAVGAPARIIKRWNAASGAWGREA